jgi:hypothetical protein
MFSALTPSQNQAQSYYHLIIQHSRSSNAPGQPFSEKPDLIGGP